MAAPFGAAGRRETPRQWLEEAYLLTTQAHVADPLGLPVREFDGLLSLVARGVPSRSAGAPFDPRSYVESVIGAGR